MIGYNVKEINELMEALNKSYKEIKTAMERPWNGLTKTLESEWVGPDEIANVKTLAGALRELYVSCKDTILGVGKNVNAIGEAWKSFQAGNVIEGGEAAVIGLVHKIDEMIVQDGTLEIDVKEKNFRENENLGLQNGQASVGKCNEAIDSYAKEVYNKVESLYQELDARKAFLGEDQAPRVTAYLHAMGKSIAKLTVCIKSVKEAIAKAASSYTSQAGQVADQVSGLKTDIDTNQSVI